MDNITEIPVNQIKVGSHEQRFEDDDQEISEISSSIRRLGLLQAICVKKIDDGYMLIYGHRRLEACKRNGMEVVPCKIALGDESKMSEITFAENFFSKHLTPIELAVAIATEVKEGRMTVDQLAAGFTRTTEWVRRQLAIVGWPEDVLAGIHTGKLSVAAASNLACITEESYRKLLVRQAVENGATARTTSAWLQAWRSMLPPAEAIQKEPVDGEEQPMPLVPQGPCLVCHDVFRVDELSHVPLCSQCIKILSTVGIQK